MQKSDLLSSKYHIYSTAGPFAVKLSLMVQHHKPECLVKRMDCCVSFQCSLLLYLHSPRVQLYASAAVYTLKIPSPGSRTIVWTGKILHTLTAMGSTALEAAVPYPGEAP